MTTLHMWIFLPAKGSASVCNDEANQPLLPESPPVPSAARKRTHIAPAQCHAVACRCAPKSRRWAASRGVASRRERPGPRGAATQGRSSHYGLRPGWGAAPSTIVCNQPLLAHGKRRMLVGVLRRTVRFVGDIAAACGVHRKFKACTFDPRAYHGRGGEVAGGQGGTQERLGGEIGCRRARRGHARPCLQAFVLAEDRAPR
jgi:hypothetical protein